MKSNKLKKSALAFIFLMGIVSLFSDFTYEGARSVTGPYLALLGASAAVVGFVSGLGEFIGYAFRIVTGYISDKTKNYWTMTIIGYGLNLIAIPLLAFVPANGWIYACGLILLERFGKAVRSPAKSTLVSFAASEVGVGKGFAIQEALDQLGAIIGPVLLFLVLTLKGAQNVRAGYNLGFLLLGVTALISVLVLILAKVLYPAPEQFDQLDETKQKTSFKLPFWLYMAAISLIGAGFAHFSLMSYRFSEQHIFSDNLIPIIYALAMGVDALAALFFGWFYDKKGILSLIIATVLALFCTPFVFLTSNHGLIIIGIILWGIGLGAQESILKSTVTSITPKSSRATAFGIFNTGFGLFWFIGSFIMGILYDVSLPMLVAFSMVLQFAAIPVLYKVQTLLKKK